MDQVIDYAVEVAARGFPLTHKQLKKVVDEICRARLGNKFPKEGIGKQWTDHFVEKHSNQLGTYSTRPLEAA